MHRVNSILTSINTLLFDSTEANERVYLGRAFKLSDDMMPAIAIFRGLDQPITRLQNNLADWAVEVMIDIYVNQSEEKNELKINDIRGDISRVIMGAPDLGLPDIVIEIEEHESFGADLIGATQSMAYDTMKFVIKYRRSVIDPDLGA